MMKRILSILLCTMIVCTQMVFGYAEEDGEDTAKNRRYEQTVQILAALDIVSPEDIENSDPEEIIYRGDYVDLLVKAVVAESEALSSEGNFFTDVDAKSEIAKNVNIAYKLGIVSGYGDGEFGPDNVISYTQGIVLLIKALGYKVQAEAEGGYPMGYVQTAQSIGLLKHVKIENYEDDLIRGAAMQMLLNALNTETLDINEVSGGQATYKTENDKTLLWKTKRIKKDKGVVTATPFTRLTAPSNIGKNQLEINNILYSYRTADADSYVKNLIGQSVIYYYKADVDPPEIVFIQEDIDVDNAITIKAQQIERYENNSIYYWENEDETGEPEKVKLTSGVSVIYNGKAQSQLQLPENGQITLVSSRASSNYDIAIITDYEDYVVNSVDVNNNQLSNKYDNTNILSLDEEEKELVTIRDVEGNQLKISDIRPWNVLAVAKSADEQLIEVIVLDRKVTGEISEIYQDGDETIVRIENEEYKVANSTLAARFSIQMKGIFYLNISDKIAAFDGDSTGAQYGYVIDATVQKGIKGAVLFKVLTLSDGVVVKTASNHLEVDEEPVPEGEIPAALCSNGVFKPQAVRYEINDDDEFSKIDTAIKGPHEADTSLRSFGAIANLRYYSPTTTFQGKYMLTPETKVFVIPDVIQGAKNEHFNVRSTTYFQSINYNVQAFNNNPDKLTPDVVVVVAPHTNGAIENLSPIMCVTNMTQTLNADGHKCYKVYGYSGTGTETSINVKNSSLVDSGNIRAGDIIKYATDLDGEINTLIKSYDSVSGAVYGTTNQSDYGNNFRIIGMSVISRYGDIIGIGSGTLSASSVPDEYVITQKAKILVREINSSGIKIREGNINDIHDYKSFGNKYSRIFVYYSATQPRLIVVYN